jgi:hypothetical protein
VTYGYHHAKSVDALTWLLTHHQPCPKAEVPVVLTCRKAFVVAQRERCERAIRGANVNSVLFQRRGQGRDIAGLARGGAVALSVLLDEYPTFDAHTIGLTNVLQATGLSPVGQAWVEAARQSVLATETAVSSTAWTSRPEQAWQIVADISDAAEAVVAIDRDLQGSVQAHVADWETTLRIPSAQLRLTARHIGYVARAGDLDADTDALTRDEALYRPIPLRGPEEIASGLRYVERLLRERELSIRELRTFALMHSEIAHTSAEMLTDPRLNPLRESFRRRDEHYRDLAGATSRVASIGPSSGQAVLAQTQEVGRVLLGLRRTGASVPAGALADLNSEHPRLAETLSTHVGMALARGRYLIVDDGGVCLRWRRTQPGEHPAISQAADEATALVSPEPTSLGFVAQRMATRERAAEQVDVASSAVSARQNLRSALDRAPYGHRPFMPNRRPSQLL